ncbi:hypothetical protein [Janthinobacterium sp. RB2P8]|uniref:hypothetical protein n=1 Tax=Janthinobacterium sp. RB2P8 TaxID=3424191 RepID=UPI003F22085D
MKSKFELKIQSFQHISFEILKNGDSVPKLGNSIYINDSEEPAYEKEMLLSKALQHLIETKTIDNAIRTDDREDLLAYVDSILAVVQAKRSEVMRLEEYVEAPKATTRKKLKS